MPVSDAEYASLAGRINALQNPAPIHEQIALYEEFRGLVSREPSRERSLRHLTGRLGITVLNCRVEQVPVPEPLMRQFTTPTAHRVNPTLWHSRGATCSSCRQIGNRSSGDVVNNDWVCQECLDTRYRYSSRLDEYIHRDDWNEDEHGESSDDDYSDPFSDEEEEEEEEEFVEPPRTPEVVQRELALMEPKDTPTAIHWRDPDGRAVPGSRAYRPGSHIQTGIYNYSEDPMRHVPGFRLGPKEVRPVTRRPFFLGVELEVGVKKASENPEVIRRSVEKVSADIGDFAVIKHDGSVSGCGYEIVSVPGTLAFHHHAWEKFFNGSAKLLEAWSVRACSLGLHVHIDRKALGTLGSGKLMVFLHSPENRKFVTEIAGRSRTEYAHYWGTTKADAGVGPTRGHYDAAGPSRNHKTIEVRIFRANVAKRGFFRSLEFIDALCHFVQWASLKELTVDHFLRWMQDPEVRSRYPNFEAWLIGKKMIEKGKRPTEEVEYA